LLSIDVREAIPQLQEKLLQVVDEGLFQVRFDQFGRLRQAEKLNHDGVFEDVDGSRNFLACRRQAH
jgi:hypothetical protein